MSKFNVETAFNELSKKLVSLTAKVAAQSAIIEVQTKKIDNQQKSIEAYTTAINQQKEVIAELSAKIDELGRTSSTSKNETGVRIEVPSTQCESATHIDAVVPSQMTSDRTRRASKRAQNKEASTLPLQQELLEDISDNTDAGWKIVGVPKKNRKPKHDLKTIQKGGNMQIATFQAIEKKKFLHVWSLHPETTEKAIVEHVIKIGGSEDVKVEKIIPKTKRDYSTFTFSYTDVVFLSH